jgi:hypothetical protein
MAEDGAMDWPYIAWDKKSKTGSTVFFPVPCNTSTNYLCNVSVSPTRELIGQGQKEDGGFGMNQKRKEDDSEKNRYIS